MGETPWEPMALATRTRTKAPVASLRRLEGRWGMAGLVQKMPSLAAGSGVMAQWG